MHSISILFNFATKLYMFRTVSPSETCTVLLQNKINLRYCASSWFYYRNVNNSLHSNHYVCDTVY